MSSSPGESFKLPQNVLYFSSCGRYALPIESVVAGENELQRKQNTPWDVSGDRGLEGVRASFSQLIGSSCDRVCICPSTSYAMSIAAKLFQKELASGGLLCVADEIESAVLPLQAASNGIVSCVDSPSQILASVRSCAPRSCVVLVTHCFWTSGLCLPSLDELLNECASRDLPVALDLTQSVGVIRYNVNSFPAALRLLMCASVHKHLMGAYGTSLCYIAPSVELCDPLERTARQTQWDPLWDTHGGGMKSGHGYQVTLAPNVRRFDAGLSNPVGFSVLEASLKLVLKWSDIVVEHLQSLTDAAKAGLLKLGYEVIGDAPHFFAFSSPTIPIDELSSKLKARCVYCDLRHGRIRFSVGMYNTMEHIDRFLAYAKEILQ